MADARGEYWYFDPDVDANKITVPELRSILLKHGVTYPSSAKKPVLVALFNEQVAPQAAKIQRAHARTKRSTRGIEDVPSSATSTTTTDDAEEEETLLPPQPTPRRTSRRTRASTEDADGVAPAPRGKTTSRAVPAKHSRASEADLDEQPALRRTRKSMTPAVKQPSPEPEAWHRDDIESPFTQDNPFQSGSSPILPETATRGGRRKTMGFEHKEKRKSDASRRKTVQPNVEQLDEGIVVPSRRTFDMPITRIKKEPSLEPDIPDSADAGEEFEPQEQMELSQERAKAGGIDILPPRRQKRSKATGTLKAFSMTLLATSAAVFGGVWRQEKIAVGFCGIGRHATGLAGVEVPEWANAILPQCEPCPPHAQCYRNLELTCDRDFIRKDHPLSLGGLIPLPPTCEPDSEKTRKITSVADKTVQILRKRRAQFECGEQDAEGNLVENPEVSKAELKEQLSAQKRKGMTDQEFSELFDRAFPEAILRDEVVESTNSTTGEHRLSSTSLAELSLSCSFRRSLRQSVERYLLQIVVIFLVIATGSYGKYSFTRSRAMEERAKYLAGEVFNRLADHAALSHQEPGANPEKGISMAQLRDDVLRNEFSSSRRQKLWERVQKKVEFNSNVRAAVRTTHSGDVARMWEWVGPVKLLEDGRSSSRQESGRYSMGLGSSPPPVPKEIKDSNAWNEDRPIY